MDAKKMLFAVATTAIGWMVGMAIYNRFMTGGMSMTAPAPDASPDAAAETTGE